MYMYEQFCFVLIIHKIYFFILNTEDEKCKVFFKNNGMWLKYGHLICFVHCVEFTIRNKTFATF